MPSPNVLIGHSSGDILPAADWDNNFGLIENTYQDIGNFVVSGLTLSAGVGLVAAVASGIVVIGAEITLAGFNIAGLTDNTVNYLWIQQNGTGFHNTTGVPPAASAFLGTATTSGGVVTATATTGRPCGPLTMDYGLPTLAAQAGAGTSPPAPVLVAGSTNDRGSVTFGTGTTPSTGAQVQVTYSAALRDTGFVTISPLNAATAALQPYVQGYGSANFVVGFGVAPAASQTNTTYAIAWGRRK